MNIYRFLFESFNSITLISFVLTSLLKRLSIQYVYERNFFVFRLSLKAGAKLKLLFVSRKKNLKKFETFFFVSFFYFFFQSFNELPCFAGCKCKKHFQISQAFSNLFFENFFSFNSYCLSVFLWTFFAVAGAKVPPLFTFTSLFLI